MQPNLNTVLLSWITLCSWPEG